MWCPAYQGRRTKIPVPGQTHQTKTGIYSRPCCNDIEYYHPRPFNHQCRGGSCARPGKGQKIRCLAYQGRRTKIPVPGQTHQTKTGIYSRPCCNDIEYYHPRPFNHQRRGGSCARPGKGQKIRCPAYQGRRTNGFTSGNQIGYCIPPGENRVSATPDLHRHGQFHPHPRAGTRPAPTLWEKEDNKKTARPVKKERAAGFFVSIYRAAGESPHRHADGYPSLRCGKGR